MKATITIDDRLIAEARKLTGVKEKTTLVRMAFQALIYTEGTKRLAELGSPEPTLKPIERNPGEFSERKTRSKMR